MAIPSGNRTVKTDLSITEDAMVAGQAQSLLETVGPRLNRDLEVLIGGFIQAPAELGALLQFQAKIAAVWHLRKGLQDMARRGKPAIEAFEALLASKQSQQEREE